MVANSNAFHTGFLVQASIYRARGENTRFSHPEAHAGHPGVMLMVVSGSLFRNGGRGTGDYILMFVW
jgi:hypothetical protein